MTEADIEKYLVARVKALGGEVRKVSWIGRKGAPDRLVMLPGVPSEVTPMSQWPARTIWVELKAPGGLAAFPANGHERAQAREHKRMRRMGQVVVVVDSFEGVEELLK